MAVNLQKIYSHFMFGGDYNPEQWPEDTWQHDMDMLKDAHINELTLNVFSWGLLEPSEGHYDFSLLDKVVALAEKNGMQIIMATSTAALPFWMVKKYPDVGRVDPNTHVRQGPGKRHNFCPNSPTYLKFAHDLVDHLAAHFAGHDSIVAWHVNNEYGGYCYCEHCTKAYQEWLQKKYKTLDRLNQAWNTAYWSHTVTDWSQIEPPTVNNDIYPWNGGMAILMADTMDFHRFMSDSFLNEYLMEYDTIRKYFADTPIFTNLVQFNDGFDYHKWAHYQDVIAWDEYPKYNTSGFETGMEHDLYYGLKRRPFLLIEQTPTQQDWNKMLKAPGQMRMLGYQAMAHGAQSMQFFQMKQSYSGIEKFHGAIISHSGREDTRAFKEITSMGEELKRLSKSGILQSDKVPSKVAMIFDWNNYWANAELNATSRNYINKLLAYYQAIARQHVNIDLVAPTADLSQYKLVVAPFMYMVTKQDRENLEKYVQQGGTLLTGAFSGMVNENDNVYLGGYPGGLRKLTGIWIEELDHLDQGKHIPVRIADGVVQGGGLDEVIHLENAKAVAVYEGKYYAGTPAVTVNDFGQGKVFHVGTYLDQNGLQAVIRNAFSAAGITGHALQAAATVDCTVRQNDQTRYYFFVNTTPAGQVVANPVPGAQDLLSEEKTGKQINLGGYGVAILAVER